MAGGEGNRFRGDMLSDAFQLEAESLRDRAHRWFNLLTLNVLLHTTYDRTHANLLLRRINAAIGSMKYYEEYHPQRFLLPLPEQHPEWRRKPSIVVERAVSIQSLWRRRQKSWMRRYG